MMRFLCTMMILAFAFTLIPDVVSAAEPVLEWNLAEMYPDNEAFLKARALVESRIPKLAEYQGRLSESPAVMKECLALGADLLRETSKLQVYAGLQLDKDLRNAVSQQQRSETARVVVELTAASAWVKPEIISLGKEKIEAYLAAEESLAPYAMFLRDAVRLAEHTLPPEQEQLLSQIGLFSNKFNEIYDQLTVSDIQYPELALSAEETVKLNQAGYIRLRGTDDRAVRDQVFHTFWKVFNDYENTFGTLLNAEVQKNWFFAKARGYDSALAADFGAPNMPVSVYESLIREVRANLPVLHRMLQLRQRILGIESQRYHDVYASIVPSVEMEFPWDQVKPILTGSLAPLGEEYLTTMGKGLDSWVDVYPADGKQNGAYSIGIWYDGHPWVLMNYNASYGSLSTLAHEMGHAMHSWLSNQNQPFPTARYAGFLAEIASTFNEILLQEYLLANEKDPQKRLFLLGGYLERVRQTVFRQTMFAEFQLEIHRLAEQGQTLTGQSMSELYLRLLREYHGHDAGVMEIEDLYRVEWAYIPHFYRAFYVYQYATGLIAATALAEQVLAEEPGAVERYLGMLSSGSSDYPIELLQRGGADLTTSQPFDIAFAAMNRALDQVEKLLQEQE